MNPFTLKPGFSQKKHTFEKATLKKNVFFFVYKADLKKSKNYSQNLKLLASYFTIENNQLNKKTSFQLDTKALCGQMSEQVS